MSQENVEIVKANYAAFAQGGIDQWLEHWADDLDFQGVNPGDERPIHGKDGLRAHIQEWIDTFDDFGFDAVELFDAGPDTVVSLSGSADAPGSAASRPIRSSASSSRSAMARSRLAANMRPLTRPSTPPGCGSSSEVALRTRSG